MCSRQPTRPCNTHVTSPRKSPRKRSGHRHGELSAHGVIAAPSGRNRPARGRATHRPAGVRPHGRGERVPGRDRSPGPRPEAFETVNPASRLLRRQGTKQVHDHPGRGLHMWRVTGALRCGGGCREMQLAHICIVGDRKDRRESVHGWDRQPQFRVVWASVLIEDGGQEFGLCQGLVGVGREPLAVGACPQMLDLFGVHAL